MGLFEAIMKKILPKNSRHARTLTGYAPSFTQFGDNIYASDVVQQAISCIVMELKKLRPAHIREKGMDILPVSDSLQAVLNNPNEFMTTSDFLEKTAWLWLLNFNAFIIPVYSTWKDKDGKEQRKYNALYPIMPENVTFMEDEKGTLWVQFRFANGYETAFPYSEVIHLRRNYSVNDYMGGNLDGQPDNEAVLSTLDINHQLLQGVAAAMKSSFAINGVVKYNTMLDDGRTEEALKELEAKIKASESGFLPLDLKAEYMPISHEVELVDAETLKFLDEKILRHWGVPLPILTGDYTKEQYEAFYQKTIEPMVIALTQAFTKILFTDTQRSHGNKINFFHKDLIFMSVDQKIATVNLLAPTGALFENEKRTTFGFMPLPELTGKRYMSLNWVDANIANRYQLDDNSDSGGGDSEE